MTPDEAQDMANAGASCALAADAIAFISEAETLPVFLAWLDRRYRAAGADGAPLATVPEDVRAAILADAWQDMHDSATFAQQELDRPRCAP